MSKRIKWSLLGIADDVGVLHVGGRLGAAKGPRAFRRVFSRLNGREGVHQAAVDFGDLNELSREINISHRKAADSVRQAHERTSLSVVIGGSHDHGYSHLLGISEALRIGNPTVKIGCINIDAHLDVRKPNPLPSSGSPFYLAIESGTLLPENFIEFGIQSHCNAPELWQYVEGKKIDVVPFSELRYGKAAEEFGRSLRRLSSRVDAVVLSFDLDAAASAFAPGVSAPQAEGFTPTDLIEMMEMAGREPKVESLGVFELNPEHDADDRTARLAATAVYHFLAEALKRP